MSHCAHGYSPRSGSSLPRAQNILRLPDASLVRMFRWLRLAVGAHLRFATPGWIRCRPVPWADRNSSLSIVWARVPGILASVALNLLEFPQDRAAMFAAEIDAFGRHKARRITGNP